MAEVKDKVVTVESLATVHEYNKNTYMSMANPSGSGTMTITGDGNFSGNLNVSSITIGTKIQLVPVDDRIEIVFLEEETANEE